MWKHRGHERPPFALRPAPGEESVWDYPRPPRLVLDDRLVEVRYGAAVIASSKRVVRILETASPPRFYVPPEDVSVQALSPASGSSHCEWKGWAQYWALSERPGDRVVGWSYSNPDPDFATIRGFFSFYPGRIACFVDGERVSG